MRHRRSLRALCIVAIVAGVLWIAATGHLRSPVSIATPIVFGQASTASRPVFPGLQWDHIGDPKSSGYCQDQLDLVTARVKGLPTTAMVVVVGGRVLWDYGDQRALSYVASVRKSILAMLYGKYVESGVIRLDATMADLKIDDVGGLLPAEREATVADLLASRSGIYHNAANAACTGCGSTKGDPPGPRGSVKHGTYFLYNNWDFNALGTVFEQQTGQSIYDAFEQDLANPIGLQDFKRAAQQKSENPRLSVHPAYHFYLSTRDMARIGLLMLHEGHWAGTQVISRDWARRIVTPITHPSDMHPAELTSGPFGYGLLWWIWDGTFNQGPYRGAYSARGAVGQYITVLPALDMVIAHKTRPGGAEVSTNQYLEVVDKIIGARCST